MNWTSAALACVACLLVGAVGAWRLMIHARTPARVAQGRVLTGALARVSLAIPAHGMGAIAYARSGRRTTLPAESVDGRPLAPGDLVVIVEVNRKRAIVHGLADIQEVFR